MRGFLKTFVFILFCILPVSGEAGSRDHLFHQGLVFDASGTAVNGTLDVAFRLYENASGGAPLWEETQSIIFDDGIFTAELGSLTVFPDGIFDGETLFLGIQIEGDSEMSPRLGMSSVPFAQQAEVAIMALSLSDNVVTGASIAPATIESTDIAPGAVGATELASSGVTAGTYTIATITVDQDGRITSASSGGASGAGSGDITAVTAGTGLTGGGTSGDVTLNVDVGTVAGRIVQLDSSAALPAISGANLTSLNASNISSGTLADARLSANVSHLGSSVESSEITDGTITSADISLTAGITDAQVSDTLTASSLVAASSVVSDAEVDNNITIDLASAATALAANGANCPSGSYALGVDASGTVEGCTADDDQPDSDAEVPDAITVNASGSIADGALSASVSLLGPSISSSEILDSTIVDADISGSAAIAGTKVSPDFGSQAITTSGSISTTGSGTITAAGDLAAAGGFKMMIGPFVMDNVDSTASWEMQTPGSDPDEIPMPWAGSVMGVSVRCVPGGGVTAGTLTVEPVIDGTETDLEAVLSTATGFTRQATASQAKDTDTFTAGQQIGCKGTPSGLTPTTLDCVCLAFVEM